MCIFAGDVDFAKSNVAGSFDTLPDVSLDGNERQIFAQINLGTIRRKDVAGKLGILLGGREFVRSHVSGNDAGIVLLAVVDSGMLDRSSHPSLPIGEVGATEALRAIVKRQFHNTTKCHLAPKHPLMT